MKKGFTLVEVIVSLAVMALFLPALARLFTFAINTSTQGDMYSKAYAMSQEGIEAIYYIKENRPDIWNWDTIPENTSPSEFYQVIKSGGEWGFDGGKKSMTDLSSIDGYTRSIQIFMVVRDVEGNLNSGSTEDKFTKKIVSKVSWMGINGQEEVTLSSYVTKH
jgi:prepilin-type N-terminal cleavage/methylation domain-containing protein